jgi:MSHA biogenesis protein MshQ
MPSSGWHMVTFVASGSSTKFYIDTSLQDTINTKPTGSIAYISASDYNSDLNGQTLGAYADEFKIFSQALDSDDITNIYNNENAGKNYDGTSRTCPSCNVVDHYEIIHDSNALIVNLKI